MSNHHPKILIVGAGPTGLTAAVELARHGIIAEVIDKRDAASTWSRAVGILPSSLVILEPSGVTESLLKSGIHVEGVHAYWNTKKLLSVELEHEQRHSKTLIALPQDETEKYLREAFEKYGGQVNYSRELTELNQSDNSVSAIFQDGSQSNYDYVIGADGINSTVRQSQNIAFVGSIVKGEWSIADVEASDWPHPTSFCLFLIDGGKVVVVVPIGKNRYRIISNRSDALSHMTTPMNISKIRREGDFQIPVKQAETYQKGRVFLAGDSAHCHSPVGGRGMNIGIADAADLARRFANNNLEGYSEERYKAGKEVLEFTERGRKIVSSSNPIIRFCIWLALSTINNIPVLRKRVLKLVLNQ